MCEESSYIEGYLSNCCVLSLDQVGYCHDLAKQLSHYLYFFSFLFFYLGLTTQKRVQESIMSQVSQVSQSYDRKSQHHIT